MLSEKSRGKRPERVGGGTWLTDLPLETQKQIVGELRWQDLFTVQRLNKHFLPLASAIIYRELDLTLTNAGDETSHAADALQSILASDYDYAQHIKILRMGVVESAFDLVPGNPTTLRQDSSLMTRILWDSKSDASKFLNTALLLVARRAQILETFQWDAPIELSGSLYRELHKLTGLRHLRVRLDIYPSPKMVIRSGTSAASLPPPPAQGVPPPSFGTPHLLGGTLASSPPSQNHTKSSNSKRKKAGFHATPNYWASGRAFSGFKTLNILTLVALSNLECLSEVSECIKASSATLNCLTLSLSAELARKARKPVVSNLDLDEPSDTELDDDENLNDTLPPLPPATSQQQATSEADIRKEKAAQEGILARVFDLQPVAAEGRRLEKILAAPTKTPDETFAQRLKEMDQKLREASAASTADTSSAANQIEHIKGIRDLAESCISSHILKNGKVHLPHDQVKWEGLFTSPPISAPKNLNGGAALSNAAVPASHSVPDTAFNPTTLASMNDQNYLSSTLGKSPSDLAATKQEYLQQMILLEDLDAKQKLSSHQYSSPYHITSPNSTAFPTTGKAIDVQDPTTLSSSDMFTPHSLVPMATYQLNNGTGPSEGASDIEVKLGSSGLMNADVKFLPGDDQAIQKAVSTAAEAPIPFDLAFDDCNGNAPHLEVAEPLPQKLSTMQQPPRFDLPAADSTEDSMDVDMDHPDEEAADLGDDQEFIAVSDDSGNPSPRKRARIADIEKASLTNVDTDTPIASTTPRTNTAEEALSPDEAMRTYIRATHGLQLDELSLEWIPLRASVVARALDLTALKRVTFLAVGPQDAFWSLLLRLQNTTTKISLKSIHTDNVSHPFIAFLGSFDGLEELFLHERGPKEESEPADIEPVTIRNIRKSVLRRHMSTLKCLMIKNDRNERWDADLKTVEFLAAEGTALVELGVSLNMKAYHRLMQKFASFGNLYALYIVYLRSADRSVLLQQESLSFAVDSLTLVDNSTQSSNMKIKYVALQNSLVALKDKPSNSEHLLERKSVSLRKTPKVTKVIDPQKLPPNPNEDEEDSGSDTDYMAGDRQLRSSTWFDKVPDVKIFSKKIRSGKL